MKNFLDIMYDDTKNVRKIKSCDYSDEGKYPIIDQSSKNVIGYTDEIDGIYKDVPVIIFGDHTRRFKLVEEPFFIGADGTKVLKLRSSVYDYKFIYYYLLHKKIPDTGYNRHFKWVKELEFPEIPRSIQSDIVKKFEVLNDLISSKNKLLELFNILIKSRFVEMFGDPNASRTKYKLVPIHTVTDCMVPGRDKPKSFTGEIPWITINDLNINGYTNKSKLGLGLTIDEVKEVNRKCVPQGSVLMSCVGNLGLCSIASVDVVINQQLHSYQCNEFINNLYLMYYLSFKNTYMNKIASSTTVLYMNKNACNNIPVLLPPIELQISFAKYLNRINKLKFA